MRYKDILSSHSIQSLASMILNEQRFEADIVEFTLSHVGKNQIRATYNKAEYLEHKQGMMDWQPNKISSSYSKH